MRTIGLFSAAVCVTVLTSSAQAQQPSIEELTRQIEKLQHRVEELEGRHKASTTPSGPARRTAVAPVSAVASKPLPADANPLAPPSVFNARTPAPPPAVAAVANVVMQQLAAPIPGLLPPEPMGTQFEDALRSDLPGLSLRIPSAEAEVRVYGFAKVSAYTDLNGRNQTDAPPPSTIPLANSPADIQGGDFGMTARFSRIGVDTRRLTPWGTFETRIEGDFGGGTPFTSAVAIFRLRQAWAEIGTESFRVLVGQANSLWNEGLFETLIDATNLNQSFVRQAQVRATAQLAPGLTGMISLEAPETQYTSVDGVFTPAVSPIGGLSPAFTSWPDLLGRMTYRENGLELNTRGLVRELSIRTAGTAAVPPAETRNAVGWGVAADATIPMRWFSEAFGADQLIGMGYYGQGIGRYFAGNTFGQDALSSVGLPGTGTNITLDALPTYGATAAYRRFWTPQLRSNFAYSYARQDYPTYALEFIPASFSATSLNSQMQQVFANLIWSPFATYHDGVVDTAWLDLGLEYLYTRREVFGGTMATGTAGTDYGVANRFVGAAIARF
jgi:hypothetical protein